MQRSTTTIHIQPQAPAKPAVGAACNGCGLCCLVEPCPLGVVLSRRRRGACVALRWNADQAVYRCGVLVQPLEVLVGALPAGMRRSARWLAPAFAALGRRWIAAGKGCDSWLEPVAPAAARPAGPAP